MASETPRLDQPDPGREIFTNLVAGLSVSFVAISLGAAFGIMSGRGALAGILSAGIIALITGLFGGTRIQASGPTAPMTAVTILVIAFANSQGQFLGKGLRELLPGADITQFVNLVFVLTGILLVIAAICRLGRFIELAPKTVISGFMNGIAILIWVDQAKKLFGIGGEERLGGSMAANVCVALGTLIIAFVAPMVIKRLWPGISSFLPGTLVAILVVTLAVQLAGVKIQTVQTEQIQNTLDAWSGRVADNVPANWDMNLVLIALPFAFQLMLLCYLDTLLTSLVIDKKMTDAAGHEVKTKRNQELAAQGVANAAVAVVGGIPGAQATIRSVLILNEGATLRLASAAVGVFVLIEMLVFQDSISLIPVAVFTGILFKVGSDVFDWPPVIAYSKKLFRRDEPTPAIDVRHVDMFFIAGTALVTLLRDLNTAVIGFTALFYLVRLRVKLPDLGTAGEETGKDDSPSSQGT